MNSLSPFCKKTLPKRDKMTGGKGMDRAKEQAFAGGSSATIVVENPPPRNPFCLVCGREFHSRQAVNGHMRTHPKEREGASILLELKKPFRSPHAIYEHMPGHNSLLQPEMEKASVLLEFRQIKSNNMHGIGTRSDDDTMPEDCTSPSAVEAQRKKICVEFDLNKEPPEDDENDNEDYGGDNGFA